MFLYLLNSCSTDSDFSSSELQENAVKFNENLLFPENKANPFDYKGREYYHALTFYQKKNASPNSILEITNQIGFLDFQVGKKLETNKNVITFNNEIVESIIEDPDNSMISIIQNSTLGSIAQSSLINFLQGLIAQQQIEFSLTYDYIRDYEDLVLEEDMWTENDKETILTVASISRYFLYSESQRKDRDWEVSAGNKPAKRFFSNNEGSIIFIIVFLHNTL
jgi:hypothetical protein